MKKSGVRKLLYLVGVTNGQGQSLKRVYFNKDSSIWYAHELVTQAFPWSSVTVWVQEEGENRGPDSLIFRMDGTKALEGVKEK